MVEPQSTTNTISARIIANQGEDSETAVLPVSPLTRADLLEDALRYSQEAAAEQLEEAPMPAHILPSVYEALPDFLRRCIEPFETEHERAVMLLSSLAVLSGCFPGARGTYSRKSYGLNLYSFILAPAASGKGTLEWAKKLALPWHERILEQSKAQRADYLEALAAHEVAKKGKSVSSASLPVKPPFKMLFVPGDTSAAALLKALENNGGRGIICETEADTLSGAMGKEFGGFAADLCKAFGHETISKTRIKDDEYLEIKAPAVSVALTGTPAQLKRLISTAENGLFSRFMFYTYKAPRVWLDVSPGGGISLDGYFASLAAEVTKMLEVSDEKQVDITLLPESWAALNEACAAGLAEAEEQASTKGGESTAVRLGLIAFRIAGVLTMLRCFEHGLEPGGEVVADPEDVRTALHIMSTLRAHALYLLDSMPVVSSVPRSNDFAAKAEDKALVWKLREEGMSLREIVKRSGKPLSTCQRWVKE
ncbi:Protein of unknown function [Hymenobacter daecheongensis DSM 21074]|uniref:DUF3987 domain-containing protein n=1 Tax=Hymenobacter daecheongensis DSM 21074 TaxID=1121955 RepID=A0A1M6B4L6_9BACT|nr:DUF3987 domain-containing protein [Hymenobacter daecheongensis]SHI43645.1 Protein of unknown function [Hymenobacter daecheongensis DSM 21074]